MYSRIKDSVWLWTVRNESIRKPDRNIRYPVLALLVRHRLRGELNIIREYHLPRCRVIKKYSHCVEVLPWDEKEGNV